MSPDQLHRGTGLRGASPHTEPRTCQGGTILQVSLSQARWGPEVRSWGTGEGRGNIYLGQWALSSCRKPQATGGSRGRTQELRKWQEGPPRSANLTGPTGRTGTLAGGLQKPPAPSPGDRQQSEGLRELRHSGARHTRSKAFGWARVPAGTGGYLLAQVRLGKELVSSTNQTGQGQLVPPRPVTTTWQPAGHPGHPNPGDPEKPGASVGAACQGAQSCLLLLQIHALLHCHAPGP